MAKKNNLLGATDPHHLQHVATGTVLSFMVFLGSFVTADAALQLAYGTPTALAWGDREGDESVVIIIGPPPPPSDGALDDEGNLTEPIDECDYTGGCGIKDPFYNESDPSDYPSVPDYPMPPPVPCYGSTCEEEDDSYNRIKTF